MPEYLSPGVYVNEVSSRTKTITGVSTSTSAFIGISEKGPADHARLVTSYDQFEENYGNPVKGSYLAESVNLFFINGGARLYIARVSAGADGKISDLNYQQAFSLLNDIDDINLIAVPGIGTQSMVDFASSYCRNRLDCFYIADVSREIDTITELEQFVYTLRNKSSYSALYYPWLQINDTKNRTVNEAPPSGAIAGIYARTDNSIGIWKAPAGPHSTINGITGIAHSISNKEQDLLNPMGVNVIRDFPKQGTLIWGSRTLTRVKPDYKYIPVRRMAIYIEQSIRQNIQWAVFEPNDLRLWGQLKLLIEGFMLDLFRQGAFSGSSASEAFYVRCDNSTTTQEDINNGTVNVLVGFAPLKPAEFVVLQIQQKTMQ